MLKTTLSSIGSLATAIVASLCCIGPAVLAIAGAGSLGAFAAFEKYRAYFIGLTAILLGLAFYITYRKRPEASGKCEGGSCRIEGAGKWNKIGLWSATVIAAFAIAYPYLAAKPSTASNAAYAAKASVALEIQGMTCTACVSHIQSALSGVKGVHSASVTYETGQAVIAYDPALVQPTALIKQVEETGYSATPAPENKGE